MSRARVVMSVPSLATAIERRALRQAAIQAGAREASLIEAPLAAAIGLGMPIQDPVGSAIVLLGAGASEAAVVSLGGIVTGAARRIGGSDVDTAIATSLRLHLGVVVAPTVVEMLKCSLASALGRTAGLVGSRARTHRRSRAPGGDRGERRTGEQLRRTTSCKRRCA